MKYLNQIKNVLLATLLVSALWSLSSCVTQKKAVRWFDNHPSVAAKYSLEKFPTDTIEKIIPGEPIHYRDTSYLIDTIPIKVPCPPNLKDTEYIEVPVPVKIPVYKDSVHQTDTKEKSIDRSEYKTIAEEAQKENIILNNDNKNLKKKLRNSNIRFWGLIGLICIGIFLKIKRII